MVLVSQKNADSEFTVSILLMQHKLQRRSIKQGCSGASRTPFYPLMSVSKLSLKFWAYLDLAASDISAQRGYSSWEAKKAFGDFINFT